jgi:chromatin remodeling complex protein RSC6
MAETLALIKRLTLRKELIEEHIEELTLDKISIQRRINDLINNAEDLSSENNSNCRNTRSSRPSSGFTTPQPIHSELANFFGLPIRTEMSRSEVTRKINKYIRENGLQDKDQARKINPDEKLKALLNLDDNTELTYFNLQKHLSPLFKL